MRTFLNLFGRSPFTPLQSHMENVYDCVHQLPHLFNALAAQDYTKVKEIAKTISDYERLADITKDDIRKNLPKSILLPIARENLLEILALQDRIADKCEDIAVLTTLKPLVFIDHFSEDFKKVLDKNIETFDKAHRIIKELHELLESSFGGLEAERVEKMVEATSIKEDEADHLQHQLLIKLFESDESLTFVTFHLWQRIFEAIASISDLSKNLANDLRLTLERS